MAICVYLALAACAIGQEESGKNPPSERKVELRVYFASPTVSKPPADQKEPPPQEMALMLALTASPNKSRTLVMERVDLKEGEAPLDAPQSQVRKLEGTSYFARLVVMDRKESGKKSSARAERPDHSLRRTYNWPRLR